MRQAKAPTSKLIPFISLELFVSMVKTGPPARDKKKSVQAPSGSGGSGWMVLVGDKNLA